MQKIKNVIKGHRHGREDEHHGHHHTADDDAPVDYVVPGSVPITGTYSKTEAEYLAATGAAGRGLDTVSEHKSGTSGGVVEERPSGGVVEERPVQVGVAEIPVVITEQEHIVNTSSHKDHSGLEAHSHEHHSHTHSRHTDERSLREQHLAGSTTTNTADTGDIVGTAVPAAIVGTGHTSTHNSSHSSHSTHSSHSSREAGSYHETSGISTGHHGVSVLSNRGEEVCGQKTFTMVEDRPVVRERVERIVEHRPVEKTFVVETKYVGEQEMGVVGAEIVDTNTRVVDVAEPGPTCPVNTGAILNEVVEEMTHTTLSDKPNRL